MVHALISTGKKPVNKDAKILCRIIYLLASDSEELYHLGVEFVEGIILLFTKNRRSNGGFFMSG